MLIFLYGPPGSGKNFVAEWLMRRDGFYFYDADQYLTLNMKKQLWAREPFTQAMRDHFFQIVIQHVTCLQAQCKNLVITQALSRHCNRLQVKKAFPKAFFYHVRAPEIMRLERLRQRRDWVTPSWVETLMKIQDAPDHTDDYIDNSQGVLHLEQQWYTLMNLKR